MSRKELAAIIKASAPLPSASPRQVNLSLSDKGGPRLPPAWPHKLPEAQIPGMSLELPDGDGKDLVMEKCRKRIIVQRADWDHSVAALRARVPLANVPQEIEILLSRHLHKFGVLHGSIEGPSQCLRVDPWVCRVLALEKAEIHGECESWQSLKGTKPDWISDRKINTILQFGMIRSPRIAGRAFDSIRCRRAINGGALVRSSPAKPHDRPSGRSPARTWVTDRP